MSYLKRSLERYLNARNLARKTLEVQAGLPNGTIGKIEGGSTPREGTLRRLLEALPDDVACDVLRSHLLDATPEDWRTRVQIAIQEVEGLREDSPADLPPAERYRRVLKHLVDKADHDSATVQFLDSLGELLGVQ